MEIRIYKLVYATQEEGWLDLTSKGIVDETYNYNLGTHAVVDLGEGMFDVMIESEESIDFGEYEILPRTPNHNFGGWEIPTTEINPLNLE